MENGNLHKKMNKTGYISERHEKFKAYEEFASMFNYSTDPSKVMHILKLIDLGPEHAPIFLL